MRQHARRKAEHANSQFDLPAPTIAARCSSPPLSFVQLPQQTSGLRALHAWLDTWAGLGAVRQGYDLRLELARRWRRPGSTFVGAPRMRSVTWVEPRLEAEVSYAEIVQGRLRAPSWRGNRQMKVVYKITYPNGKIYIGKDLTGSDD